MLTPRPSFIALKAQALATGLALGIHFVALNLLQTPINFIQFAFIQGTIACLISYRWHLHLWWFPIQFLFLPGVVYSLNHQIHPGWWAGLFSFLLLLNWNAFNERVPIYLSSPWALKEILKLLPTQNSNINFSFIDLGCGFAGPLVYLSKERKNGTFTGVETAPLIFLFAWLRSSFKKNCHIQARSIWNVKCDQYDFIYAFLSPTPMNKLWKKLKKEMKPGSMFISNTFAIPGVKPNLKIEVNDLRKTTLYIYSIN